MKKLKPNPDYVDAPYECHHIDFLTGKYTHITKLPNQVKINPEWKKLGKKADIHFLFNKNAFKCIKVGPAPKSLD
jgi:hypothetical protein